jgi:hypothetical protein
MTRMRPVVVKLMAKENSILLDMARKFQKIKSIIEKEMQLNKK